MALIRIPSETQPSTKGKQSAKLGKDGKVGKNSKKATVSEAPVPERKIKQVPSASSSSQQSLAHSPSKTKNKRDGHGADSPDDDKCIVCSQELGESCLIKCDTCPRWIHYACSGLRESDLELLSNADLPKSIKYLCVSCQLSPPTKSSANCHCSKASAKQDLAIESLTKIVSTLQSQMEVMLGMLAGKESESTLEKKVEVQFEQVMQDEREREEKKNNVMLFNVPESNKPDAIDAANDDLSLAREILIHVSPEINFNSIQVSRIGSKKGEQNKHRPLKIKLDQTEHKFKLLKEARKLKNYTKHAKIGLSKDKTKRELIEDRALNVELRRRRAAEPAEDFVIFRKADKDGNFKRVVMLRSEMHSITDQRASSSRSGGPGPQNGAGIATDH